MACVLDTSGAEAAQWRPSQLHPGTAPTRAATGTKGRFEEVEMRPTLGCAHRQPRQSATVLPHAAQANSLRGWGARGTPGNPIRCANAENSHVGNAPRIVQQSGQRQQMKLPCLDGERRPGQTFSCTPTWPKLCRPARAELDSPRTLSQRTGLEKPGEISVVWYVHLMDPLGSSQHWPDQEVLGLVHSVQ